jgi:hypothetical protein
MHTLTIPRETLEKELRGATSRVEFVTEPGSQLLGYFVPADPDRSASDDASPPQLRFSEERQELYGGLTKPTEFLSESGDIVGFFVPETEELRRLTALAERRFPSEIEIPDSDECVSHETLWQRIDEAVRAAEGS